MKFIHLKISKVFKIILVTFNISIKPDIIKHSTGMFTYFKFSKGPDSNSRVSCLYIKDRKRKSTLLLCILNYLFF